MARNIVRDYIDYDRKKMIKYIDIITEKKLYSKITDMIVDTYVNVRYFDMYEHVKNNIIDDISYYVKEKLETEFESKNTKRNNILVNDALIIIRYVILLEKYHDDVSISNLIIEFENKLVAEYQDTKVIVSDLIKTIKEDIISKKKFINSLTSTDFSVSPTTTNLAGVFNVLFENNVKIPDLFSQVAINRVYNTGVINEDKMVVFYLLTTREILKDMVDFDYGKVYLLDFVCDLLGKKNKFSNLLKIFDLDYLKDRMILKISYQDYIDNRDRVDDLIHGGLSFAIILNSDFNDNSILLDIFDFIIVNDDIEKYPMLKKYSNVVISR